KLISKAKMPPRRAALLVRLARSAIRGAAPGLLVAALAAGCGGTLPVATAGDAARAGVALAELQQGRSLVASKCSGCHRTPLPTEHRSEDWPKMIEEMSQRAH